MRKLSCCTVLTLACAAVPARAQVFVNTPWVQVRVGVPGQVLVQTPWVTVGVPLGALPARPMAPAVSTVPTFLPGEPPPVPLPIPVETAATRVPTLSEFAAAFNPKGGRYEVVIQHPATGQPVKVSFSLPDGTPRRMKVHRRDLEFDYRGKEVSIRFLRGGEVRVKD
jgi:hypothetical protein